MKRHRMQVVCVTHTPAEDLLTTQFPPTVAPAHVGVYHTVVDPEIDQLADGFSYWSGRRWSISAHTPELAWKFRHTVANQQRRFWVGLKIKL